MKERHIKKIHSALREDIADLRTQRALPTRTIDQIDPFLFLNHHGPQVYPQNNDGLPFGPHPHRGFQTVTFILDGDIAHRDSGGNESVIGPGGIQWMVAGRGLVHEELSSEEFMSRGGPLEILQLWINLPARLKMTPSKYTGLQVDQIPAFEAAQGLARVQVISGTWNGHTGPIQPLTDTTVLTLNLKSGANFEIQIDPHQNVFFYVVRGAIQVNGQAVEKFSLVEFSQDGELLKIEAKGDSYILLCYAEPFKEPVVSYGPFVMNTREEIQQAIVDFQSGRF